MAQHKPVYFAIVIITTVALALCITISYLSSSKLGRDIGLFKNSTGGVSDGHYIEITPAGWTFSIWGFIYAWQILWILYGLTTLCRKGGNDEYLYVAPPLLQPVFYLVFIFNLCTNVTWAFVWDRQLVHVALGVIMLAPFSLYVMLFLSFRQLNKFGSQMIEDGQGKEIWLVRIIVQNGLAFYATWTTIATLLNFAIVLAYKANLPQHTASSISLAVLGFEILLYFSVENFIFDKYMRYLFSPYIVIHLALIGSISKNWNTTKTNSIITAILLALGGVLTILKIIMVIWKHRTQPVFPRKS